jgi:hypothetical protein
VSESTRFVGDSCRVGFPLTISHTVGRLGRRSLIVWDCDASHRSLVACRVHPEKRLRRGLGCRDETGGGMQNPGDT